MGDEMHNVVVIIDLNTVQSTLTCTHPYLNIVTLIVTIYTCDTAKVAFLTRIAYIKLQYLHIHTDPSLHCMWILLCLLG